MNRQWLLSSYPNGVPRTADFSLTSAAVGEPREGEVRVRVIYLSMDPAPRVRMDPVPRLGPPLALGAMVIGRGAGVVEVSRFSGLAPGDTVTGELGWQEVATVAGDTLKKVDCSLAPLSAHLGVLASSGLTAYLTLKDCARAGRGETVVVSAAAGSVGLAACQMARLMGCRVVGIAHGARQAAFLGEKLALDGVIDGYDPQRLPAAVAAACPSGIDVFLDSVGGALHNAVMGHLNVGARAVLYGFISAYNAQAGTEAEYGRIYTVIKRRAHVMGFLLGDHAARFGDALREIAGWLRERRLDAFEQVSPGFEAIPAAFADLFGEAAPGKHLVQLAPDPSRAATREVPL